MGTAQSDLILPLDVDSLICDLVAHIYAQGGVRLLSICITLVYFYRQVR